LPSQIIRISSFDTAAAMGDEEMKKLAIVAAVALLAVGAVTQAEAAIEWLHVHVDEGGHEQTKVRVNVPVSMVAAMLPLIHEDEFHGGKVHVDGHELDKARVRAILKAVTEAEEGEYITVESWHDDSHEEVRVAKQGGMIIIKVREEGDHSETVDIRMPVTVVEALLKGKEDELNVVAAVEALREAGDAEIIVTDSEDDTKVRIWVDTKAKSNRI
jgi:hypothetical protein